MLVKNYSTVTVYVEEKQVDCHVIPYILKPGQEISIGKNLRKIKSEAGDIDILDEMFAAYGDQSLTIISRIIVRMSPITKHLKIFFET